MKRAYLLFFWTLIFAAQGRASVPSSVDALAKDFEATKKSLEEAEIKQRKVLSALYQVNKKIKKLVTEKGNYSHQRSFLELNVRNLSQKVVEIDRQTKVQRTLLAERLRAIYKLGGPSVARFLFSSGNSTSLESNLKILGLVAARDLELIKNYSRDLQTLERKREVLSQRLEGLKLIERKIAQQDMYLRQEQALKSKVLDGIRKSKMFALNKINGLREKSLQFNLDDSGLFDVLFKPSFGDQKGGLPPPLSGVVTRKFGLIKGEEHPYTLSHKGVFISAAKGTPIKSVFEGRVSYVGELSGFGTTLIVDHGDHYYSVYSHTQDVKVKVGDDISQFHTLAQVGDLAHGEEPGLYFEIRHFSEPYDPQQWMKGL